MSQQMSRDNLATATRSREEEAATFVGLPMETSPYLKYNDLEDYKNNAYGTQGHLQVNPDKGGGGTDAPTITGSGLSQRQAAAMEAIVRLDNPF